MSDTTGTTLRHKPTLDAKWAEMDKATKRVAVLARRIIIREQKNDDDRREIHDIKSGLGVA